jgi:hypothetical protein
MFFCLAAEHKSYVSFPGCFSYLPCLDLVNRLSSLLSASSPDSRVQSSLLNLVPALPLTLLGLTSSTLASNMPAGPTLHALVPSLLFLSSCQY